jgi:uncharacterized protein YecE (DUF72 family)
MADLRIGCSGWVYDHWKETFYPAGLRAADRLAFYAARFSTAEINASFYRLPTEQAVANWARTAPEGFVFAWKVSRYLTHSKRLKDPQESLALVFDRMQGLGAKAGPALFQLPPQMKRDDARLAAFLPHLPRGWRHVIEFRHPSWYAPEVLAMLEAHDVALCLSDHAAAPAPWAATASFVYVRGHGPSGRYFGDYTDEALNEWAARIAGWRAQGRDVYAYFDNDIGTAAPADASRLIQLLVSGDNPRERVEKSSDPLRPGL